MVANVAQLHQTDSTSDEISRMQSIFTKQQQAFRKNAYPSAQERIENIKKLKLAVIKYENDIAEAINQDFSCRSKNETLLVEVLGIVEAANYTMKQLRKWMQPEKRKVSMLFAPAKNQIHYQPLGVVGNIVPWNYPIYLAIGPLLSMLAAGNRVMIKMSEFTPETNRVFKQLISETFDEDHIAIIEGEKDELLLLVS